MTLDRSGRKQRGFIVPISERAAFPYNTVTMHGTSGKFLILLIDAKALAIKSVLSKLIGSVGSLLICKHGMSISSFSLSLWDVGLSEEEGAIFEEVASHSCHSPAKLLEERHVIPPSARAA
ncbi:hypothetical protein NQZ68_017410 [Dissostichus eleginoides]|nr:hypothetical protein NQZ68_017410 [Dissostichus eleginoides]